MGSKMKFLLLIVTVFVQWQSANGVDCPDAIKPSNEIPGCQWKETVDANKCKTFTINCGAEAKIDKGCLLDSDNGPCFAHITKYYYNARVGKCSPFVFGGCSANANNFNSQAECTSVCINGQTRKTPDVSFATSNTGNEALNCTGVNEQYYGCGACDSNCNSTIKTVCSLICRPAECGCVDGYVRNADNICVAPDKCKDIDKPVIDPNAGSNSNAVKPTILTTIIPTTKLPITTRTPTTVQPSTSTSTLRTTVVSTTSRASTRLPSSTLAVLLANLTRTPTFTLHPAIISTVVPSTTKSNNVKCGNSSCQNGQVCRDGKCVAKLGQQLCSLISCPPNYSCLNGTCIPSNSKCDKLKLAVAASGCKHSFRNDSNGCAIPYLLCNNITCGQNEEAKLCGACDGTCGAPVCIPAEQCLRPSCGCFSGYVRNKANKCVPKKECSVKTADKESTVSSQPKTSPTSRPQSTTPTFYSFHNKVLNSIYTGVGPARIMTPN